MKRLLPYSPHNIVHSEFINKVKQNLANKTEDSNVLPSKQKQRERS